MLLTDLRNLTSNHVPFVRSKPLCFYFPSGKINYNMFPDRGFRGTCANNGGITKQEERLKLGFGMRKYWQRGGPWSSNWMDLTKFLIFILLFFETTLVPLVECDRYNKGYGEVTTTTEAYYDENKPGIVKQTFEGNESSYVPGVSAAMIVIIVFLISIFACCIHCPFCLVYRRNDPQRVV